MPMPPMASSSSADMSIFIHANTHVRPVPATAGLQVTQGWWNDSHAAEIAQARDTLPKHSMRTQWNLDQVFKYQWLLDELTQGNPLRNGPLAIVDADTVFQCNGTELRRRFDRIKSPLVIGAERDLFPSPTGYGVQRIIDEVFPLPRHAPRHQSCCGLRYPNSGFIMGTPAGFKQLWDVMRSLPNFPCCSFAGSNYIAQPTSQEARHRAAVHNVSCLVDDQACLHAALQSGKVDFMLDVNASFVLNMHVIRNYPERLARIANRIAYLRTASVPCVLHFNGAGKPKLPTIVAQTRAVWVADYSQQEPASSGKWGPNLTIRDLRDDEY